MTDEKQQQMESTEEEPQVYVVKKDVNGWRFDRRTFLALAGAATATAAMGTAAGCGSSQETVQPATAVVETARTATPSSTPLASDTSASTTTPTLTKTPEATHTPTPAEFMAQFIKDVTVPYGTMMKPGQPFTKTWRFRNAGAVPWGQGIKLVYVEGKQKGFDSNKMAGPDAVDVPNVAPGKSVDVSVDLVAPEELGRHRSYWRLQAGSGQWLENILHVGILVAGEGEVPPGEEGSTILGSDGEIRWLPCSDPIPPGWICTCNCVAVPPPGDEGAVPPGEQGATLQGPDGQIRSLPCGDPIPPGWICTCNCVSVPSPCSCDAVHYWHPC